MPMRPPYGSQPDDPGVGFHLQRRPSAARVAPLLIAAVLGLAIMASSLSICRCLLTVGQFAAADLRR